LRGERACALGNFSANFLGKLGAVDDLCSHGVLNKNKSGQTEIIEPGSADKAATAVSLAITLELTFAQGVPE
jgi:hypothetical protein